MKLTTTGDFIFGQEILEYLLSKRQDFADQLVNAYHENWPKTEIAQIVGAYDATDDAIKAISMPWQAITEKKPATEVTDADLDK